MPAPPPGGRGRQKEDPLKLVVCIGGGDHLQAINQQTKTSLMVTETEYWRTTSASTPQAHGGERGGNRKKIQVKPVVCVGGGVGGGGGEGVGGGGGAQPYVGVI